MSVGFVVGNFEGEGVGDNDGRSVGMSVGFVVGNFEGEGVGDKVGWSVGTSVGWLVPETAREETSTSST